MTVTSFPAILPHSLLPSHLLSPLPPSLCCMRGWFLLQCWSVLHRSFPLSLSLSHAHTVFSATLHNPTSAWQTAVAETAGEERRKGKWKGRSEGRKIIRCRERRESEHTFVYRCVGDVEVCVTLLKCNCQAVQSQFERERGEGKDTTEKGARTTHWHYRLEL